MSENQYSNSSSQEKVDSEKVNIQPSEPDSSSGTEDPGRTPGKAEGSVKKAEEDLAENEQD